MSNASIPRNKTTRYKINQDGNKITIQGRPDITRKYPKITSPNPCYTPAKPTKLRSILSMGLLLPFDKFARTHKRAIKNRNNLVTGQFT